ncbi:hypothetical protein LX36DRAFT_232826 [Colletotrichum falcatum]|nr:hypothetical protein LX36DRAFT_232826 [Colletotrichum falcatum]
MPRNWRWSASCWAVLSRTSAAARKAPRASVTRNQTMGLRKTAWSLHDRPSLAMTRRWLPGGGRPPGLSPRRPPYGSQVVGRPCDV